MPSAPSIPANNQGYGYEETASGILVMQKSPDKKYSGTKVDSVGPGHYNPNDVKETSARKGTEWFKFKTDRGMISKPPTGAVLGPGSYSFGNIGNAPLYKSKPSAAFVSNSKRIGIIQVKSENQEEYDSSSEEDEGVPGPGYYYKEEVFSGFKKADVPLHLQYFGSRTNRFQYKKPDINLSPGQYGDLRQGISSQKQAKSKAPFASSENRFKDGIDPNPGPGSYKEENIVENLNRKV